MSAILGYAASQEAYLQSYPALQAKGVDAWQDYITTGFKQVRGLPQDLLAFRALMKATVHAEQPYRVPCGAHYLVQASTEQTSTP